MSDQNISSSRQIVETLGLLRPYDIDVKKTRIGPNEDGGYILADTIRPGQPVLSFGIGTNCDFEFALAERGHDIFMFDPTIETLPRTHSRFNYYPLGLMAQPSPDGKFITLDRVLELTRLAGRDDIILKVDIEGAEIPVFAAAGQTMLSHFTQIVLELHWLSRLGSGEFLTVFAQAFRSINVQFTNFHVHGNNHRPIALVGGTRFEEQYHITGGFPVAEVLELSYIRTTDVSRRNSATFFPTTLDYPNKPEYPDHMLAFFPFLPSPDVDDNAMLMIAERSDAQRRR